MQMLLPSQLLPGDKVVAVSLSWGGPGTFPYRYEAGKEQLEKAFGLRLVAARHALRDAAWLARHPEARAEDLMEAFADPGCRGIISSIGGEDSIRILPFLDLDVIRQNPKVFLGYSDTTITHFACFRAGLVSFYGPAVMAGFAENRGLHPYLESSFRRLLFEPRPYGRLEPNTDGWTKELLDWAEPSNQEIRRQLRPSSGWRFLQGESPVTGPLIGGCLEVLEFLKGTAFWPAPEAWDGAIVFLETSEEGAPANRLTRFFRNLDAQGILQRIGGVLFGRPGGVDAEAHPAYDRALVQTIGEEAGRVDLPIVSGMDFGHTDPILTLPLGIPCRIDPVARVVSLETSAVRPRSEGDVS